MGVKHVARGSNRRYVAEGMEGKQTRFGGLDARKGLFMTIRGDHRGQIRPELSHLCAGPFELGLGRL